MPNATILAPAVMVAWIPFTLLLFWKCRPPIATTISIVGAGLFLPYRYAFDLPSLPPIDRESLAALTCLAAMLFFHRHRFAERLPLRGVEALVLIMLLGGLATVLTNRDVLDAGRISLPGLKPWDAMPFTARAVFIYWVPFYLGRLVFRDPRDLKDLCVVLAVLGVIYCLPILWEARMSPSLHYRVYGYHPAGFIMSKRELFFGWRPMVFVGTGLAVSMTMLMAAMSSWTLWRTSRGREKRWLMAVSAALSFFVFMCNSVGTILYLLVLSPVTALSNKRVQRAVLIMGFMLVLFFPILRASGSIPTDLLVRAAASYSESRAASLKYRFDNEDILLEKARGAAPLRFWWLRTIPGL